MIKALLQNRIALMFLIFILLGFASFALSTLSLEVLARFNTDSSGFVYMGSLFLAMALVLFLGTFRQK